MEVTPVTFEVRSYDVHFTDLTGSRLKIVPARASGDHDRQCYMVSEHAMRAHTSTDSEVYLRHRRSAASAKIASSRSSSNFAAGVLRALHSCAKNEVAQHLSAVHAIRMGFSFGTGTDPVAVPVAHAGRVACNAEAWREPSRAVCSFFRKSKPRPL